jgi:hypothetical protein
VWQSEKFTLNDFSLSQRSLRAGRGILIALPLCSTLVTQAWALECPIPQKLAAPGVLKETQAQIDAAGKILTSGDLSSQTRVILSELRRRYPGVENAELVNYMITAYCPVVARLPGLSDGEKQAQIGGFVTQLMQMVY